MLLTSELHIPKPGILGGNFRLIALGIYDPLTHSTGFVYSISKTFYSLCTADDISNVK